MEQIVPNHCSNEGAQIESEQKKKERIFNVLLRYQNGSQMTPPPKNYKIGQKGKAQDWRYTGNTSHRI